jgi:stage II sporulation protein AA (anti-sigma F factor antagonist)
MDIFHSRIGSIHLLQLRGRLDSSSVEALSAQLMPLTEAVGHQVILELTELQSLTTTGLRLLLVQARKSREQQGGLVLCGVQGFVREVFELSGFVDLIPIESGRKEAFARLNAAAPGA